VVTPICRTELVSIAHACGQADYAWRYTPTEAQLAHEAGADFIKIFPADNLGPGYIKALRAPLPTCALFPREGVDCNNVTDFFQSWVCRCGSGVFADFFGKLLKKRIGLKLARRAGMFVNARAKCEKEITSRP
jgi:2-dehydro-3-deoxyphosphogluconate aldolase/(4S)-4-hydroxy-2-oxoglutarate aldolase